MRRNVFSALYIVAMLGGFAAILQGGSISSMNSVASGSMVTTVNGGAGISTSNSGGTVTVTNTGVLSNAAGAGISVSSATGNNTITNTGVLAVNAGTGVSASTSSGTVTVTNTGVTSAVAGTGISVSGASGAVTINNTGVVSLAGDSGFAVNTSTGTVTGTQSSLMERRQALINGDFRVWTRGTSFTPAANTETYTADMWSINIGVGATASLVRATFSAGLTNPPGNPSFFYRYLPTVGSTTQPFTQQKVLDVHTFSNQTVTFSAYLYCLTGTINVTPQFVQNFGTGGSPSANVTTTLPPYTVNSSLFSRFSSTVTIPSISGKTFGTNDQTSYLAVQLLYPTGIVTETGIADAQLELGSTVTPYRRRPINVELEDCQYFHQRMSADVASQNWASGFNKSTTVALGTVPFLRQMRGIPMVTFSAGNTFQIENLATTTACTAIQANHVSTLSLELQGTVAAGLTAGQGCIILDAGSSFIDLSADL